MTVVQAVSQLVLHSPRGKTSHIKTTSQWVRDHLGWKCSRWPHNKQKRSSAAGMPSNDPHSLGSPITIKGPGADSLQRCPAHAPVSLVPLVSKLSCKPDCTQCTHTSIYQKAANAMKCKPVSPYDKRCKMCSRLRKVPEMAFIKKNHWWPWKLLKELEKKETSCFQQILTRAWQAALRSTMCDHLRQQELPSR